MSQDFNFSTVLDLIAPIMERNGIEESIQKAIVESIYRAITSKEYIKFLDQSLSEFTLHKTTSKNKFTGTEEELNKSIKDVLPKFISDNNYLETYKKVHNENEFRNIEETLVECIERKYISDFGYYRGKGLGVTFMGHPKITEIGERFLKS